MAMTSFVFMFVRCRSGLEKYPRRFGGPTCIDDFLRGVPGRPWRSSAEHNRDRPFVARVLFNEAQRAMNWREKRRLLMGKFSTARAVCAP